MSGVQALRLPLHYCVESRGSPSSGVDHHGDVEGVVDESSRRIRDKLETFGLVA
jgi:hypothetical protein